MQIWCLQTPMKEFNTWGKLLFFFVTPSDEIFFAFLVLVEVWPKLSQFLIVRNSFNIIEDEDAKVRTSLQLAGFNLSFWWNKSNLCLYAYSKANIFLTEPFLIFLPPRY